MFPLDDAIISSPSLLAWCWFYTFEIIGNDSEILDSHKSYGDGIGKLFSLLDLVLKEEVGGNCHCSKVVKRCPTPKGVLNTLRPRQNGRHFADDTFKRIFMNENVRISINISLKFVPNGLINNIPALVQIMAWRRPGDKPLSEPIMVNLLTHICITRPQWVNRLKQYLPFATCIRIYASFVLPYTSVTFSRCPTVHIKLGMTCT